jgi:hypothetical protein
VHGSFIRALYKINSKTREDLVTKQQEDYFYEDQASTEHPLSIRQIIGRVMMGVGFVGVCFVPVQSLFVPVIVFFFGFILLEKK